MKDDLEAQIRAWAEDVDQPIRIHDVRLRHQRQVPAMRPRSSLLAAAAVLVVIAGVIAVVADTETAPTDGGEVTADPIGDPSREDPTHSSTRCVSQYSPETLTERSFAFDGTAIRVGNESDPRAPDEDVVHARVEFRVNTWFSGGRGGTAAVWMQRPVEAGDRLLVAGEPRWGGAPLEDPIAWECGFTIAYSEARSKEWSAAFANG